jgi:acyl-CoA thioester hydrolase
MPYTYTHTERVRFGDLDAMRHLNNVVFLRYFETARIAFMRELMPEHDPAHPERDATGVIFAECQIRYRSPVLFDEVVAVECVVGEVRRSAFEIRFTMRVDDRVAAEGSGWLVGYDYTAGRAHPLPDGLRAALEDAAATDSPGEGAPP